MMMRNQKGFTLLELILAVVLIGIVFGAIYTMLSTGMRTYSSNLKSSTDQVYLRNAMMRITKLEHQSSPPTTCTGNTVTLTISEATHVLKVVNGSLVDVVGANTTTLAGNISQLEASKSGTTLSITLTGVNGTTMNTQFYSSN